MGLSLEICSGYLHDSLPYPTVVWMGMGQKLKPLTYASVQVHRDYPIDEVSGSGFVFRRGESENEREMNDIAPNSSSHESALRSGI